MTPRKRAWLLVAVLGVGVGVILFFARDAFWLATAYVDVTPPDTIGTALKKRFTWLPGTELVFVEECGSCDSGYHENCAHDAVEMVNRRPDDTYVGVSSHDPQGHPSQWISALIQCTCTHPWHLEVDLCFECFDGRHTTCTNPYPWRDDVNCVCSDTSHGVRR